METQYILELTREKLQQAADMLRYDCAFEVEFLEDIAKVHCIRFTRERWQSFGVIPKVSASWELTAKEAQGLFNEAKGFTEGIRFAQTILGQPLIQSK